VESWPPRDPTHTDTAKAQATEIMGNMGKYNSLRRPLIYMYFELHKYGNTEHHLMRSCSLTTVVCEQQRIGHARLTHGFLFTKVLQYNYGTFMCKSTLGSLSLTTWSLIWTNVNVLLGYLKKGEILRPPLFRDHWASCVDFSCASFEFSVTPDDGDINTPNVEC
jgi:hypothetical protein